MQAGAIFRSSACILFPDEKRRKGGRTEKRETATTSAVSLLLPCNGSGDRSLASSGLFEKVFLETLFDHFLDAGAGGFEAVEHGGVGLLGFRFPEDLAGRVQDGRGQPGAGAVENHPLLGHDLHDEIGLFGLGDLDPGAARDEFPRHILDLIGRNGMLGVIDNLEIHFVSGSDGLREAVLGEGARAQQAQEGDEKKFDLVHV